MIQLVNCGTMKGLLARSASLTLLVTAMTPDKIADQPARPVWLTDNLPRAALSLKAVVNRSRMCQSLVGWVKAASRAPAYSGTRLVAIWPKFVTVWPFPVHVAQVRTSVMGALR